MSYHIVSSDITNICKFNRYTELNMPFNNILFIFLFEQQTVHDVKMFFVYL